MLYHVHSDIIFLRFGQINIIARFLMELEPAMSENSFHFKRCGNSMRLSELITHLVRYRVSLMFT